MLTKKNILVRSIGCVYIYLVKNIDVLIILITMSQEIRLHKLLRKSKFSRICVTSTLRGDFRWLKGDPAPPPPKKMS